MLRTLSVINAVAIQGCYPVGDVAYSTRFLYSKTGDIFETIQQVRSNEATCLYEIHQLPCYKILRNSEKKPYDSRGLFYIGGKLLKMKILSKLSQVLTTSTILTNLPVNSHYLPTNLPINLPYAPTSLPSTYPTYLLTHLPTHLPTY